MLFYNHNYYLNKEGKVGGEGKIGKGRAWMVIMHQSSNSKSYLSRASSMLEARCILILSFVFLMV